MVYDPYSAAFKADPWPVYRQLRDTAPVHSSEKWGFHALSRLDGIDIDDTATDMSAPGFLPDIDNPRHDQLRRIAPDLSWPVPHAVFLDVLGLPTTRSDREDLVLDL
ncbi:hypothetical protein ACQPWY_01985 [Pseudonocardia xinjiangensis]|uniref:hypothetical protein n=1 Tax=Pseudonocardia xinjiangensis TaxID=75289 RepID=UPI003D937FBD